MSSIVTTNVYVYVVHCMLYYAFPEVYDNWDEWEPEDEMHCEDPNFNV